MDFYARPTVHRCFLGLWCLAWVGGCALLMSPVGPPEIGRLDLVAHAALFGTMTLMPVTFCRRVVNLGMLTLLTVVAGGALEWAQGSLPSRRFDYFDAIANTAGAVLGFGAAFCVQRLLHTRSRFAMRQRSRETPVRPSSSSAGAS